MTTCFTGWLTVLAGLSFTALHGSGSTVLFVYVTLLFSSFIFSSFFRKRHANRRIDIVLIFDRRCHSRDYASYGADYAAVAVEEEREVFAQASGVTCLICQLVIEGSLVSTSRR